MELLIIVFFGGVEMLCKHLNELSSQFFLFSPENCIWNNFEDECFDEDPIPVGGYPDSSDDAETCENCDLEAEQIAEEPVSVEDEETENPRFMQPVKIVSSDEVRFEKI